MRKAQGGLNAAILIAIIAGLIILYILFLPEDEREALLENKTIDRGDDDDNELGEGVLLREFIGRIDTVERIEDKDIPNIFLFETTNAKELQIINPFIVRNGVFDEKIKTINFGIDDLENVDNVILSLRAKKHDGTLTIKLNNNLIFENDIDSETVSPISLDRTLLRDVNTLEFSVTSVGFRFWKTNEYSLEDIRIIGDITDKSKQESRNIFTISSTDLFNIEEADLRFVPYCGKVADVGTLDIAVNGRNIFSAVPVCEDPYKQPIPLGLLDAGENRIVFKTNKGSYSVEQIEIRFEEKDIIEHVFFFEVSQSTLDDINDNEVDAILTIEFVGGNKNKRADLNVNGRFITIDDDERIFSKNINNFLEEGNNFVEIRPRDRLDIVELRIELEDT